MNSISGTLKGYDCPKCNNRGYSYTTRETEFFGEKRYEIVSVDCNCKKIRNELVRIKNSGLEKISAKRTLSKFKTPNKWQKHIKAVAESFLKSEKESWFYIGGQPGCGKTHICTAIAMELLSKNKTVRYMVWTDEAPVLKAYINDVSFAKLIHPFQSVDVLYIDDLFKTKSGEKISTADVNMALRIINHRYNAGLQTIISSELSIENIIDLDEALGSRIAEMTNEEFNTYIASDPNKNYRFRKKGDIL